MSSARSAFPELDNLGLVTHTAFLRIPAKPDEVTHDGLARAFEGQILQREGRRVRRDHVETNQSAVHLYQEIAVRKGQIHGDMDTGRVVGRG